MLKNHMSFPCFKLLAFNNNDNEEKFGHLQFLISNFLIPALSLA
jgi:hypothetical protein